MFDTMFASGHFGLLERKRQWQEALHMMQSHTGIRPDLLLLTLGISWHSMSGPKKGTFDVV